MAALESLRGVAAISVLVYHVAYIPGRWTPTGLDLFIGPLGLYGVPLFFVLSAFVLWYGYASDGRVRGGTAHFYRRRFFRIAPLYYLILLVHILFIVDRATIRDGILPAATLTFGVVPGHGAGIVMAGWSIGVEMVFYAVFPLLVWGLRRWSAAVLLLGVAALVSVVAGRSIAHIKRIYDLQLWTASDVETYVSVAYHVVFFAAGIVAALAFTRLPHDDLSVVRRIARPVLYGSIAVIIALFAVNVDNILRFRPLWAVALAGLVFAVAAQPPRLLLRRTALWAGTRSFSIYLVHPVVIVALMRIGVITWADQSLGWMAYPAAVLVSLAVTLAVSALTYRFIEQPGMALGGGSAVGSLTPRRGGAIPASS